MRFFSSFFQLLRSSLSDLRSYGKRGETFWKGIRYLYTLCVFASFILALKGAVSLVAFLPHTQEFIRVTRTALSEAYPPELVVVVESGALSTNVETPFAIDIPPAYRTYFKVDAEKIPHLIVIDPEASIEDFPSYQTLLLLTQKSAVFIDKERGEKREPPNVFANYRVTTFNPSNKPLTITKEKFDEVVHTVESYFGYVQPVFVLFIILSVLALPFLTGVMWLLGSLIFLLWTTLLLRILSYFTAKKYTYKHIYVLSLYGVSASVLYSLLENLLGFHLPFVATILLFATMYFPLFRSSSFSPKKT